MTEYSKKSEQTLVQLFRFLQAKETFIKTYVQFLSERVLKNLSKGGTQKEKKLALLFKQECGDNFNQQTEQIILDIE